MNTYIGTKMVQATPMSRQAYNDYRDWNLPEDEDGADDGYLVEYTDGGKPNDDRHAGYISWSPKAQFDAAYVDIGDVSGLAPHQQRVVAEKAELDARLKKLDGFMTGLIFTDLAEQDQIHLLAQSNAMWEYAEVLAARIARFGSKEVLPS